MGNQWLWFYIDLLPLLLPRHLFSAFKYQSLQVVQHNFPVHVGDSQHTLGGTGARRANSCQTPGLVFCLHFSLTELVKCIQIQIIYKIWSEPECSLVNNIMKIIDHHYSSQGLSSPTMKVSSFWLTLLVWMSFSGFFSLVVKSFCKFVNTSNTLSLSLSSF